MADKKKVLEGHKKVGSKFVPPMMQISGMTEVSYVNQILPEIIWMGLINDKYGYRRGIELVTNLAKAAFELKETEKHVNFSLASSYSVLSHERKSDLLTTLAKNDTLTLYQASLSPLIVLYESCPLSFLGTAEGRPNDTELLEIMRGCIERHDKYKTPGLVIQATALYVRGTTGGLFIAPHIEVPDLNSLIERPDSEEAKRAAGFVRSSVMSEFMPMGRERSDEWARAFWNQGYRLDSCDFSWETNDLDE